MSETRDFEQLVRRHQGAVCAVAYAVLRDRGRSEEVAQDAFLIAWQKLPTLAAPPAMPAWICGIARNLALNAARRNKEAVMESDPPASETPLTQVLDREADELAAHALAALAERDREVVVLYYRGDGSLADVASALGISEIAARQRLHRGRERLKRALAAVEATLRATRPGVAFTAACVAALGAGVAPKYADAAPARAWSGAAMVVTAGVLAVGGGGWAIHGAGSRSPAVAAQSPLAAQRAPQLAPPPTALRRIDAGSRAAILDTITAARAAHVASARTTGVSAAPALPAAPAKVYDFADAPLDDAKVLSPPPAGASPKVLIRYAIQQIQPLLRECYTAAAPHLARKTGTIEVRMRLIGEPEIGTLVDSVTLGGDESLVGDAELAECMRETLMTVELPAMTAPDTWDVIYPLVIADANR